MYKASSNHVPSYFFSLEVATHLLILSVGCLRHSQVKHLPWICQSFHLACPVRHTEVKTTTSDKNVGKYTSQEGGEVKVESGNCVWGATKNMQTGILTGWYQYTRTGMLNLFQNPVFFSSFFEQHLRLNHGFWLDKRVSASADIQYNSSGTFCVSRD